MPTSVRPVVPAALQWPAGLEPELLACGSEGMVAMARGGMGAYLPPSTEGGFGTVMPFTLEGLMKMGLAQSLSWGDEGLLAHTSSGAVVSCPMTAAGGTFHCSSVDLPPLPTYGKQMAVVLAATKEHPFRAAVVAEGKVRMHALKPLGLERDWHVMAELDLPLQSEVTSLTGEGSCSRMRESRECVTAAEAKPELVKTERNHLKTTDISVKPTLRFVLISLSIGR